MKTGNKQHLLSVNTKTSKNIDIEREVKVNNQESINDQRKIKEAIYTCRQRVCEQWL